MIEQFLMPLDRQFDSGFGAMADAFHGAAKSLDTDEHQRGFGINGNRLPIFYLYRHANELYLKSVITILYRRFNPHYPNNKKDDFPTITILNKSEKIHRVHSIKHLYEEFRRLLSENGNLIKHLNKTDWTDVPDGIDKMVELIDNADDASGMFRYPFTKNNPSNDAKKSPFKNIHPIKAFEDMDTHTRFIIAVKNDDNEIVETFIHDKDTMTDIFEALKELSNILTGVQCGMLSEFLHTEKT